MDSERFKAAVQAEMMIMLRCWYRASQYVMDWVINSSDKPLGSVTHAWFRYEFQEETPGFPHIHALLTTADNPFSEEARGKICCSKERFLGSIKCKQNLNDTDKQHLAHLFQTYQSHICEKAGHRCQKKTDDLGQPICRVPKYPPSEDYSYKKLPMNLSFETLELMHELELMDVDEVTNSFEPIANLQSGKHHYPANYNEHISPTNADFFALVQSSSNVQICDGNAAARYVAKYAAGVESRGYVKVTAGSSPESVKVQTTGIINEKIAGVKASFDRTNREARKQTAITGRLVSVTESLWYILDFPYVCSNVNFIHIPSTPKEYRSAIVIEKTQNRSSGFGTNFLEGHRVRSSELKLPAFRQFTPNQLILIEDVQSSHLSADKVTVFGLRPPELLFVEQIKLYFCWFVRTKLTRKLSVSVHSAYLKKNFSGSFWIDALGYRVRLRSTAIEEFVQFCSLTGHRQRYQDVIRRFRTYILPLVRLPVPSPVFVANVQKESKQNPVIVFTNTLPSNPNKFLIHFILTFGKFQTELDLFHVVSLKQSFVGANLFVEGVHEEGQINSLARAYYLEQLKFVPGSLKLTDKYLPMAHSVLREALLNNSLYFSFTLPSVLDYDVCLDAYDVLVSELAVDKQRLIDFLVTCLPCLPTENEMLSSSPETPCTWTPTLVQQSTQSNDSFSEQRHVLSKVITAIDSYKSGNFCFIRHHVIVGPPGTGKSYLLFNSVAYAICQGLHCMITSLAAERSASLNGKHINALIPFPVDAGSTCESLARVALSRLQRDPIRSRYLQSLNVVFVEEISMISSEIWAAIDHVLQTLCSNFVPFGGKLIIATGDFFQLPPPSGSSLISSTFPLTTFHFLRLNNFVRMQNALGQELLQLMGQIPRTDASINRCWEIISSKCQFVETWDKVDNTNIRIFATRKAEREATLKKIEEVTRSGAAFQTVDCNDEMCTSSTNNWVEANTAVKSFLNRNCLEPDSLFLYVGAIMRLTVNMKDHQVFQGQLCVIVDISELLSIDCIKVAFAPPGCRVIPDMRTILSSWRVITLRRCTNAPLKFNFRTTCRRTQFPLKLFVASTIHKTMGETLPKVATQIVGCKHFSLWLAEQLYVVASRVRQLQDITFVGCKVETEAAVKALLLKHSQWALLTNAIFNSLSPLNVSVVQSKVHPFPVVALPRGDAVTGFCYLLQSAPQPELTYIGSTMSLKRRLSEHNSGCGSAFTKHPSRRPWILVCYITGFPTEETDTIIREFEREWIYKVKTLSSTKKSNVSVKDALLEVKLLITSWRMRHNSITLVICSD